MMMQENNTQNKKRISISVRVYTFMAVVVFMAGFGASMIAYRAYMGQIDTYYKNLAMNTAINFASFTDGDYLQDLLAEVKTDEYIALRDAAEAADDEDMIRDHLKSRGLWDKYDNTRSLLIRYLRNMDDIKYLYIMKLGDEGSNEDIYLIDDDENPLYVTGSTEEDYLEVDGATGKVEPAISNTEWGWLCSAYAPVYDSDNNLVCHVGCDVSMDDVMASRSKALWIDILGSAAFTLLVMLLAIHYTKQTVIKPLGKITDSMGHFSPSGDADYERSGVIDLKLRNNDEISDIYHAIQSMQKRIVDYIKDIVEIQKEKEIAEKDVKRKERQIGKISKDAYHDALTHVGNSKAYSNKIAEMNRTLGQPDNEFAIVMIDVNFLKTINDKCGHAAGDAYLTGCCSIICNIYKHSPVYRVGGDEFVVILTGNDYRRRNERLKRMRETFEKSYAQTDVDPWLRYSAASGMAKYTTNDNTVEAVYERADKEMYKEKARFKESLGMDPEAR